MDGYDYSLAGAYFITICTQTRTHWFGQVEGGTVTLFSPGAMVLDVLRSLPDRFPFLSLDEHVVIPNHVHFLVVMSTERENVPSGLGEVIRTFKAASTRFVRKSGTQDFSWQSDFHDHIVRDEYELNRIREYIAANPENWHSDPENLGRTHTLPASTIPWAR